MACDGTLIKPIQWIASGGESPRDINLCGNILLCANENSDNVTSFSICMGACNSGFHNVF